MTLVSSSDVWTFISSSGELTAGRVDADRALFPSYTDDAELTDQRADMPPSTDRTS